MNPNGGVKAFNYFKGWDEDGFNVSTIFDVSWGKLETGEKAFSLPEYFDANKGDLFIGYAEPVKYFENC